MEELSMADVVEKDNRHRRIKNGNNYKKRENVKEVNERKEKQETRFIQSQQDKGMNTSEEEDLGYCEGQTKKIKKKQNISNRLTKEEKNALYQQDEQLSKPVKKGKSKLNEKARMG